MIAPQLIDTHCHLAGRDDIDVAEVIHRASIAGVTRMVCIGAGEGTRSAHLAAALAETHPEIWASAGIHPHDAGKGGLTSIEPLLQHPRVVALGETGLDYFRDWSPVDEQRKLFRTSIEMAKRYNKKLIIHSRSAEDETLATLKELEADKLGGVFHCFSGDLAFAERIFELNFLISITGTVTFKNAHTLREVVRKVPLERLMLETDSPYMAPEPFRGGKSEPAHVYEIAKRIAIERETSIAQVAEKTTATARAFFGI